jgi:hypothetical protein
MDGVGVTGRALRGHTCRIKHDTTSPISLLDSDLNDFLFATVGDETNGMPLNVSALTRLGVDPWDEAARLSVLPKYAVIAALAPRISRLPTCRLPRSDNWDITERLVALLPVHREVARQDLAREGREG